MKKTILAITATAISAPFLAAPAMADREGAASTDKQRHQAASIQNKGPEKRQDRFNRMDTDSDGTLSIAEISAVQSKMIHRIFERLDADENGILASDEAAKILKRFDIDEGGTLSRADAARITRDRADKMFQVMDQNGDGKVGVEEFLESKPARPSGARGDHKRHKSGGDRSHDRGHAKNT
jgi:Ca2+-binding EF-hand superfamily protein